MNSRSEKKSSAFVTKLAVAAALTFAASASHALQIPTPASTMVTVPASSLKSSPGVYTTGGYYTNNLGANIVTTGGGNAANVGQANGRNDDGYTQLNLGFNVTFFGHVYNSLFINNNGSVSFEDGVSAYVPTGVTGVNAPIISPFFGDVDTRNAVSDVVYANLQSNQLVVTWNNVGYFDGKADALNSFQLVLRGDSYVVPTGEGLIGFFYEGMAWERTDTSTVGAVGFGDGEGNGETIAGSLQPGMNKVVQDKYVWFDAKLDTVPEEPTPTTPPSDVPEPSSMALMALGLLGAGMFTRRKSK